MFQSLIGRLKTADCGGSGLCDLCGFQSLIGRLKTVWSVMFHSHSVCVSIPHR